MARRRARPPAEPTADEQRRWDRAADLMSRGAICVTTRGRVPTDADLDAVEQFAAFLHRQPLRQTAPVLLGVACLALYAAGDLLPAALTGGAALVLLIRLRLE